MVKILCGSLLIGFTDIQLLQFFFHTETFTFYCFIYPSTMISNRSYSTVNWLHGSSSIVASLPRRSWKRQHKTKNVGSTKKHLTRESSKNVEVIVETNLRVRHQTRGFKSSSCKDRNCLVCSAVLPTMHLPVSDQEFGLVFLWHPGVWAHLRKAPFRAQVGPTCDDAAKDGKDSQKWSLPLICHSSVFCLFPWLSCGTSVPLHLFVIINE